MITCCVLYVVVLVVIVAPPMCNLVCLIGPSLPNCVYRSVGDSDKFFVGLFDNSSHWLPLLSNNSVGVCGKLVCFISMPSLPKKSSNAWSVGVCGHSLGACELVCLISVPLLPRKLSMGVCDKHHKTELQKYFQSRSNALPVTTF